MRRTDAECDCDTSSPGSTHAARDKRSCKQPWGDAVQATPTPPGYSSCTPSVHATDPGRLDASLTRQEPWPQNGRDQIGMSDSGSTSWEDEACSPVSSWRSDRHTCVIASSTSTRLSEHELWSRALRGDREAFAAATGRFRRELEVHCYRMLGSLEDAEDVVQETLLRAWRRRETFRRESTLRAWLYGIATNGALDLLEHRSRRLLPQFVGGPPTDPAETPVWTGEVPWLEPYPDRLLDEVVDGEDAPEVAIVAAETIELAF